MRKFIIAGMAVAMLAIIPAAASASVTLDPATGTGFVGKGDVQTAYGWNDQKLQLNASGVSFRYETTTDDTYSVTCEWDTGNKQIVHHKQTKSSNLLDSIAYDLKSGSRVNPNTKVNGFNLTGIESTTTIASSGDVPVVGQPCPETGNDEGTDNSVTKLITAVELVSSDSTEAFFAIWDGIEKQLVYPTAVIAPVVA